MNITVVLPSLNPDEKMVSTVKGLIDEGFLDIVVVNDGSDKEHVKYFDEVDTLDEVTVLTHEINKGKGRAMKTAFSYVLENRKDTAGVITVDGDGQHLPKDIKSCVEALLDNPDKVVLGVRDFSGKGIPARSRFGNNVTKAVFRFACGIKISDTQTGLRAIPYKLLPLMLEVEGERYEYETNQLLVLKSNRVQMKEVIIETVYLDDNQSSHFHPIRDSIKIYAVIFKYIASSFASFLIDIAIFTLINILLGNTGMDGKVRLAISTAGARIISSLFNYTMNRKVVFKSDESVGKSIVRYYILCICQAIVSYGLVYVLAELALGLTGGMLETLIKLVVDTLLFLISFQIQQRWVFSKRKSTR